MGRQPATQACKVDLFCQRPVPAQVPHRAHLQRSSVFTPPCVHRSPLTLSMSMTPRFLTCSACPSGCTTAPLAATSGVTGEGWRSASAATAAYAFCNVKSPLCSRVVLGLGWRRPTGPLPRDSYTSLAVHPAPTLPSRAALKLFGLREAAFRACQLDRVRSLSPLQQQKWQALNARIHELQAGREQLNLTVSNEPVPGFLELEKEHNVVLKATLGKAKVLIQGKEQTVCLIQV
eukprot:1161744-Pelagomonas_calceolata.AAC.17